MASRTVANLTAVISANNTKFKKGVGGAKGVLNSFKKSVLALGPAIAGAFAVSKLTSFGKESLRLYDIQAKAEQQLLTALKGRENAQQRLIAQAQYLQKQTLFGDEETIRAQALIAAFVKEEDQIRRIIPLVQDLAAAKQMDLAGAADLVSKTLGSTTNALSRYGIQVEGTVGSTERLESLARGLNDAFGGQAEAMAKSGTGSLKQLQNAFADLKEEIGGVINMPLANWAQSTADALNVAQDKGIKFGDKILGVFMPAVKMANRAIADMNDATAEFEIVGQDAAVSADDFALSNEDVAKASEEAAEAIEKTADAIEKEKKLLEDRQGLYERAIGLRQQWSDQVKESAEQNIVSIEGEIDAMVALENVSEKLPEKIDTIADATARLSDSVKDLAVRLAGDLASSLGAASAGASSFEEVFADLASQVASALGDILIAFGLALGFPAGLPFIAIGLGSKFIGGAMGASPMGGQIQTGYSRQDQRGSSSSSRIYGNDIKTANDYATDLYNRVG